MTGLTPLRATLKQLEQLRDELQTRIANLQFPTPNHLVAGVGPPLHETWRYKSYQREVAFLHAHLAAVETEIASRLKP